MFRLTKSFMYAFRGLLKAWREEANFRFETVATLTIVILAVLLRLDGVRVAILALTCGLVLALELVNTMIEQISDVLKPRLDQYVKHIKDLSAAAVLVAALTAIVIAVCLLLPPIFDLFRLAS